MTIILETKRLILRKPKLSDAADIVDGINHKPTVKNLTVKHPYSKNDAISFIKMCQKNWRAKPIKKYYFFIELKSENKVIGDIDLNLIKDGIGNTGSWIHRNYRRKGYITEAKIAVNNFFFKKLNLRKMETNAFYFNIASNKTQLKMGYIQEGLFRKHGISGSGKIHDCIMYGLLKSEWIKREKILKKELKGKY